MPLAPRPAASLALVAALALLPGCEQAFGTKDALQPGTALGTFHVTATRTENTCGEGALGSTPTWEFDVELARDKATLFWDNGAQVVSGPGSADGTRFQIDADVVMNMREGGDPGPPCSIHRHDTAVVTLPAGDGADVATFTGTLTFAFAPTAGSDCADLVLGGAPNPKTAMPIVTQLPCDFGFSMAAARTKAP